MATITTYVQNFLSILTQTQTKALILWREKEFVRSWDWATYIESVFKKVEEKDFQKLLNTMKEPQPIMFKLSLGDFQQARLLLIRYILHSDYIDLNLEHVLSRAIGTYKHFKDGKRVIKEIIEDRIRVENDFNQANMLLNLTENVGEKVSPSLTDEGRQIYSPNCIKLFDVNSFVCTSDSKAAIIDNVPPVIKVLSTNKYVDKNDSSYVDCLGKFILSQCLAWKAKSSLNDCVINNDAVNGSSEVLLKTFTELFSMPLSKNVDDAAERCSIKLPLCSAEIASSLSHAYFPFAKAYLLELIHAALEISNGNFEACRINVNSNIKPMEAREVRPRFQHLMNRSPRLNLLCTSMLKELMDNGIDVAKILH